MQNPFLNPNLSMKAKGLFGHYAAIGKVVSADELSISMPEGRDSIQAAINELKLAGYIITYREHINKKWNSYMKFTQGAKDLIEGDKSFLILDKNTEIVKENDKSAGHTDNGFSGHMYVCTTAVTNTNTMSTIDSSIYKDTNVSLYIARTPSSKEKEGDMSWNLDGEKPKSKSQARRFAIQNLDNDISGSVGKLEDKVANRQAKYGAISNSVTHRNNKPEEEWTTGDLVAEFISLFSSSPAGNLTMQINTQQLSIWINRRIKLGATRQQVLSAIRMFFDDPRNLNGAGTGLPIWRRFLAKYQSLEGRAIQVKPDYEVNKAHQEKMLRLLGGNNV
jgi:hypothetical protein